MKIIKIILLILINLIIVNKVFAVERIFPDCINGSLTDYGVSANYKTKFDVFNTNTSNISISLVVYYDSSYHNYCGCLK